VAPFAVAAALPFVLTPLFGPHAGSAQFIASGALTAVLIVVAFLFPWERVPPPLLATVPLTWFVVVFLLRDSSTTAAAVYTPLVLLPVIWLALYGNRGQLLVALACLALTLIIPILAIGAPHYPPSEWRRVAIYLAIAPIVGMTILRLVTEIRVRADRLTRSEAQTREGRDLLASVLRGSTEYSIIGTDSTGVIRVFNKGAERMLGIPQRRDGRPPHAGGDSRPPGNPGPRGAARNCSGPRGAGSSGAARRGGDARLDVRAQGRRALDGEPDDHPDRRARR
jgi:PAS domain-containing protein